MIMNTAGEAHGASPRAFPAAEFVERRRRLYDAIGGEAYALLQGAPAPRGYVVFRQTNEFFYCCGLATPQSYLLLDGRERRSALYLPERGKAQLREGGVEALTEGAPLELDEVEALMRDDPARLPYWP